MAIVSDMIRRAYRRVGVVAADEPMTAEQLAEGLAEFNAVVRSWESYGLRISAQELREDDQFPLSDAYEDYAITILAARLAEAHALPGPDPREALDRILAMSIRNEAAEMPLALRRIDPVARRWSGY